MSVSLSLKWTVALKQPCMILVSVVQFGILLDGMLANQVSGMAEGRMLL
jgi:hypothetical protein